ncbi:hypothetical protein BDV25DRAFT_143753 [Aspergillus avenaceus]|uniref:Carrier domain-containing protein n=1 Tax=Aspergillus avenaceus TaxID=36643 RepID=A0A5N6TJ90_ASPAV|nr:hypothetical protein BDV25DRAFT_143753 [Aspergillus avenaceus]
MNSSDEEISQSDLLKLWDWNETVPTAAESCVHDLILQQALKQPDAPAVCAWDGNLTYRELDKLSSCLAYYLVGKIEPNSVIPLCFEKSMWTSVAILGVMKAGGASVIMDTTYPETRLRSVVSQIQGGIVLSSVSNQDLAGRLVQFRGTVIVVNDLNIRNMHLSLPTDALPYVQPSDKLYVVFTSGSTGTPKGAIITHSNFSSAIKYQQGVLHFDSTTRAFDFASYAFDVTWSNVLHCLAAGGCLCVPHEDDRRDHIASSIKKLQANYAHLTPTVARSLKPLDIPDLRHLSLIGEPMTQEDVDQWQDHVDLTNTYGPSECTVTSTATSMSFHGLNNPSIGRGIACNTWVADPADHNRLVPIGCAGELLIEGPIVGEGYLSNPQQTMSAFIQDPPWLIRGSSSCPGRRGRVYKTGDLVRYESDGTLAFIGRKDAQVKIRGMRVELGDIESHVKRNLPDSIKVSVVTDFITPSGNPSPILVTFLSIGDQPDVVSQPAWNDPHRLTLGLQEKLTKQLPSYMIPNVYIHIDRIPETKAGKTDRRRLHEMGNSMTLEQITNLNLLRQVRGVPKTKEEKQVRKMWAVALDLEVDSIGLNDSFFHLGGNSISAMRLPGLAREVGLDVSVAQVFQYPILCDLAAKVQSLTTKDRGPVPPFSLLSDADIKSTIVQQVMEQCQVSECDIQDIYPCTALQEGLLSLTTKVPGAYIATFDYQLPVEVDLERLRAAWEATAQSNAILRTRIIQTEAYGSFQVVLDAPILWETLNSIDAYNFKVVKPCTSRMHLGAPLLNITVFKPCDECRPRLLLTLHHAVYDEWSLPLLLERVELAYKDQKLTSRPFNSFVAYCKATTSAASAFWQSEFADLEATVFPPLPLAGYIPSPAKTLHKDIFTQPLIQSKYTLPTKLQLAWATVVSQYTDSSDVIFGMTVNGRGAPVMGVEEMSGPTIATIPVRLRLDKTKRIADMLQVVQHHSLSTMPFEQMGIQNISRLGETAMSACQFQSLLVIQPERKQPGYKLFLDSKTQSDESSFTYALTVICQLSPCQISVKAVFDEQMLDGVRVQRILNQFTHAFEQLSAETGTLGENMNTLNPEDFMQLRQWNASGPKKVHACVHDLIKKRCLEQPNALAVCAWDGTLTYQRLDELSTCLASHLSSYGVGPEVFVPVCFEKSQWTTVAMLGILKAGGAFVLLDPSHPFSRLQTICASIQAKLILSSTSTHELSATLATTVVVVSKDAAFWHYSGSNKSLLVHVQPSHPVYVAFTSGSTGKPKGAVIEHAAYCSSAQGNSAKLNLDQSSRVLQFASYAFGASILETLTTLMVGGCICVPSELDRRNDIARAARELNANWVLFTPSALKLLCPGQVPSLRYLVVGGEPTTKSHMTTWAEKVTLIIAYGPAECAVCCAVQPHTCRTSDPLNIGRLTGSVGWIVDREDHNKLVPIGAVGELLVEGPILARGYLGDSEKTALAFIKNPPWLRDFRKEEENQLRLYKTGDLVQYTADGAIRYIGRKDTQVKLRGQRIELGEVEHHVYESFRQSLDVVAEVVFSTANFQRPPMLVAFVRCDDTSESNDTTETRHNVIFAPPNQRFHSEALAAENRMQDMVPSYMVPAVFIPLRYIPLTGTGKTDRRQLRELVATLSERELESYISSAVAKRQPSTETERMVQQLWAQVLNIEPQHIGVDDNFFRLGGDSISAMHLSSKSRARGFPISVPQIFQHKTVASLALCATTHVASIDWGEQPRVLFGLSPIQQMFFEKEPEGHNHFNQSFFLETTRRVQSGQVLHALVSIVARHSMLRARFSRSHDGNWFQYIISEVEDCFRYRYHQLSSLDKSTGVINQSQESLDIQEGPVFAVDLLDIQDDKQYIFLVAHHLVIDLVSWRIILEDLEEIVTTGTPTSTPLLPFQAWCRLQSEYSQDCLAPHTALPYNLEPSLHEYWDMSAHDNIACNEIEAGFTLNEQVTETLYGAANAAFHTQPVEIFHAALLHSFGNVFHDRKLPTIYSEGHGREPWDPTIDISKTVGWFTTIWPAEILLDKRLDVVEFVRHTKDSRRRVPSNGWAYFTSRYLNTQGIDAFKSQEPPEVLFNYLGLYQQFERPNSLLQAAEAPKGTSDVAADVQRFALIDVLVGVTRGCLQFKFVYNRLMKHQEAMQKWVVQCERSLEEAAQKLVHLQPSYTLCDFPLLPLTYNSLEHLQDRLVQAGIAMANVEEIYPCSPIQLGILLSQVKDPEQYQFRVRWQVRPAGQHSRVDPHRLKDSWHGIVSRHSTLHTEFIESVSESGGIDQVVLKKTDTAVHVLPCTKADPLGCVSEHRNGFKWQRKPLHWLVLCPTSTGDVFCDLEINHAIVDGTSVQQLKNELRLAYNNQLPLGPGPLYRDYIKHLQGLPKMGAEEYWQRYLDNMLPCLFPALNDEILNEQVPGRLQTVQVELEDDLNIHEFCREHGVTLSNVFQVAWGLVLRCYTSSESVCFGYLSSGREVPVPGVQEAIGPFINMLVSRMDLRSTMPIMDTIQANQADYLNSMTHQHCLLADTLHNLEVQQPLFNTAMSLQKLLVQEDPQQPSVTIEDIGGDDPTEYAIVVDISVRSETLRVSLTYWESVLSESQATGVAATFSKVISGIISHPYKEVGELDLLSAYDISQLYEWNAEAPAVAERCVHDIIQEQILKTPDAVAICAWDGELSYRELNDFSSRLASYLVGSKVGVGSVVPLCFEKSMWTPVAMLGVMKAGGASVAIDVTQPEDRLRSIMHQIQPTIILASMAMSDLAGHLEAGFVVTVDRNSLSAMQPKTVDLPTVDPSSMLCMVFSSGSTGMPKGIVLSHTNFNSALRYQKDTLGIRAATRIFDFASYAFDAAWFNFLHSVSSGACLCIPSESARRDDLAACMNQMRVDLALLTPSIARTLDPVTIPSLRTLILGGESYTIEDAALWIPYVDLYNVYGPGECSVVSTAARLKEDIDQHYLKPHAATGPISNRQNIGHAIGCLCWVVDWKDHEKLLPIGAVGELLIEGPIVGLGYLGSSEKTAAAFIEAPAWLRPLRSSNNIKIYKTGDLVQYASDRSLRFVGRKDTQVKLRGQRIEMGDVEHHTRQSFPGAPDVIAEVITPAETGRSQILVAFICGDRQDSGQGTTDMLATPTEDFRAAVLTAKTHLHSILPTYMVPAVFLPLVTVPLTTTGKTDRLRLRGCASALTRVEYESYNIPASARRMPATAAERTLQQLWARVLNMPADTIGADDSFFRLGGDSITAMQLSSLSRSAGFSISVSDVFHVKTISGLAPLLAAENPVLLDSDKQVDIPLSLSPIQSLFFRLAPYGPNHFNQSFLVPITKRIEHDVLIRSINSVVHEHPMLRARFSASDNGGWNQTNSPQIKGSYRYQSHVFATLESARDTMSTSEQSLDIQNGPVFSVDLIDIDRDQQYIFLVAHHLVVDLVSWRIILGDLEDLLQNGQISGTRTLPFQNWCQLQADYALNSLDPTRTLPFTLPHNAIAQDYWGPVSHLNTWDNTLHGGFTVSKEVTANLFGRANDAFQTQPVEIFRAAIWHSFVQTFPDRPSPIIFNEGHGREPWDSAIDLSRTVGWFTTMWPMRIELDGSSYDPLELVRRSKDTCRRIPGNGWAYFTSRLLHPDSQDDFGSYVPVEIMFNYVGLYQQFERDGAILGTPITTDDHNIDVAGNMPRFSLVDISAEVKQDRLQFSFSYNRHMQHQDDICRWILNCKHSLLESADQLMHVGRRYTLCDFPLLSLTYDGLDTLVDKLKTRIPSLDIEDVYPCSPMQRGILISQTKDTQLYQTSFIWKVISSRGSPPVDLDRLQQAWQRVIDRHAILRTSFIDGVSQSTYADQVVQTSALAKVHHVEDESGNPIAAIEAYIKTTVWDARPPHQLLLCSTPTETFCALHIHHALIDAHSMRIIEKDFRLAYDKKLPAGRSPLFSKYISYLQQLSEASSETYWKSYMEDANSCIFPNLSGESLKNKERSLTVTSVDLGFGNQLREFCQHQEVTLPNLFQVAWGLLLRAYTGSGSVCFGYINSGRDVPVPGAHGIVGPFINMLVCRMELASDLSILSLLKTNQNEYLRSLPHQHHSLIEILRLVGNTCEQLFNTVISVQRLRSNDGEETSIQLETVGGHDPTEYDITVTVSIEDERIQIYLNYWTTGLSDRQAEAVINTFKQIVFEIARRPYEPASQLNIISEDDRKQIYMWNREIPASVDWCVHVLIEERCRAQPDASAVCAWDGDFTYKELDQLSSALAVHLRKLGVGPEAFVPLCFEKSRWTIVAMVGVMKAGGAFVQLDMSHPRARLQGICREVSAQLIVTSASQAPMAEQLATQTVIVGHNAGPWSDSTGQSTGVMVNPHNALYAIFTSGSTGTPKGAVITHSAFCTSASNYGNRLALTQESRVLHFVSYGFGVSIADALTTLLFGGCICVPSETARIDDLATSIHRYKVNWAHLTPSVIRSLRPQEVPSLQSLMLTGEPMSRADVKIWATDVQLMNSYGSTECSVFSSIQDNIQSESEAHLIGRGVGCVYWIVDQENHAKLQPFGAVGELLIEGPIVGRGYLNDPGRTAAAFIDPPVWLRQLRGNDIGTDTRSSKQLYKTGDLVQYTPDGSVRYIGRKSSTQQAKLRGHRIDVGKVEYQTRQCFPGARDVIAEVVTLTERQLPTLVAFVWGYGDNSKQHIKANNTHEDILAAPTNNFHTAIPVAEACLRDIVPASMVPSVFLPVVTIPLTASGKTDRNRLRNRAAALSQEEVELYRAPMTVNRKRMPTTAAECTLQRLWARVLGIPAESIGVDDSFFHLGGDSITAMKLAKAARDDGLGVSTADMFRYPTLSDQAARIT